MKLIKFLFVMQRYFMQSYFVSLYLSDREKTGTKFSNSGCTPPETRLAQVLVPPGGTSRGTQLYVTCEFIERCPQSRFRFATHPFRCQIVLTSPTTGLIRAVFARSTRKQLAIVISSKDRNVKRKQVGPVPLIIEICPA